jgi:hypothetical protein
MTTVSAAPLRLSYAIASLLSSGLIVVIGHLFHFDFVADVLAGMFDGRSVGWALSKGILG